MAGWNDPYEGGRDVQREKLTTKGNDFDQMLADQQAEQVKIWGGAFAGLVVAFAIFLGVQING